MEIGQQLVDQAELKAGADKDIGAVLGQRFR